MAKFWMRNALRCLGESLDIHNLDNEPGKVFIMMYNQNRKGGKDPDDIVGSSIFTKLVQTGYTQIRVGSITTSLPKGTKMLFDVDDTEDTDAGSSNSSISGTTPYEVNGGIEYVDFAWDREDTFSYALRGIKSVIIHLPQDVSYYSSWYKHYSSFLRACRNAGVKHYVKLSFYLSNPNLYGGTRNGKSNSTNDQLPKYVKIHKNCDDRLINMIIPDEEHVTQMSYKILATSHYMSNPVQEYKTRLATASNGRPQVYVVSNTTNNSITLGHYGTNYISPNDVAEAAVRVVLSPQQHYNQYYTLLGTCDSVGNSEEFASNQTLIYRHDDINRIMSKYYDTQFDCIRINDLDVYRKILDMDCTTAHTTKHTKERVVVEQSLIASGYEEYILSNKIVRNDFAWICHHPPESFVEYLTYSTSEIDV